MVVETIKARYKERLLRQSTSGTNTKARDRAFMAWEMQTCEITKEDTLVNILHIG